MAGPIGRVIPTVTTGSLPGRRRDDMTEAFALDCTYVQLADGAAAVPIAVDSNFWERISKEAALQEGRLVTFFHLGRGNVHWEMHPAGDELLFLVSGKTAIVLDDGKARRKVLMKAGEALIVPRGVWHCFEIEEPGDLLAITRGAGTEVRDD
jgi:mannose-6-phosphate isomerase-like protein (cupin superfamily)